jgi:hypothetical protein
MMEYTLVFRRTVRGTARGRARGKAWAVVRPPALNSGVLLTLDEDGASQASEASEVAQVFVVPICSALSMESVAYEHFLADSGALDAALYLLGASLLKRPGAVVTARKQVQALVMAAEVQHIVDRMSA